MAAAVQLPQSLAIEPAVERRPVGGRGPVGPDDVQVERLARQLLHGGERLVEARRRLRVGDEQQLERPGGEVALGPGVERRVDHARIDRRDAGQALEGGGHPGERLVGGLDEPARLGRHEPVARVEADVGADALPLQHAREIESVAQAEGARHEARGHAVQVGDAERRREARELRERQYGRGERVAHLIQREEHGVRAGLVQCERVGVAQAAALPREVAVDVGEAPPEDPAAQLPGQRPCPPLAAPREGERRARRVRHAIARDGVTRVHRPAAAM